jgi:hypothetical protein
MWDGCKADLRKRGRPHFELEELYEAGYTIRYVRVNYNEKNLLDDDWVIEVLMMSMKHRAKHGQGC